MICEREQEIRDFKQDEYWTIEADLHPDKSEDLIKAQLAKFEGTKLKKLDIGSEKDANKMAKKIEGNDFIISNIEKKTKSRKPQIGRAHV